MVSYSWKRKHILFQNELAKKIEKYRVPLIPQNIKYLYRN
jgi:hypothetical protein